MIFQIIAYQKVTNPGYEILVSVFILSEIFQVTFEMRDDFSLVGCPEGSSQDRFNNCNHLWKRLGPQSGHHKKHADDLLEILRFHAYLQEIFARNYIREKSIDHAGPRACLVNPKSG